MEDDDDTHEQESVGADENVLGGGLSASALRDFLSRMAQMSDEMCDMDRDRDRAMKFVMGLNATLNAYKELYYDYVNKAQQRTITDYLSRLPPPPPPTPTSSAVEMDVDIADEELDAILEDDTDAKSTFSGFDDVEGDDDESLDSSSSP